MSDSSEFVLEETHDDISTMGWGSREMVAKAVKAVGSNEVTRVEAIDLSTCLETYPCQGHVGVRIHVEGGWTIEIKCDTIPIAAVMKHFTPHDVHPHFKPYLKKK